MTAQEIYDELLKDGFTKEFLDWFIERGLAPSMPVRKCQDEG